MSLTEQRRPARDFNKFPTVQLIIIALVRVAEPIAITSIFPYAWKLVLDFQIGDRSNASFYAGILVSAFSLAESITGMYWGGLSDRIGRKPVLLLGCTGTMLSLLMVGFSTNFWFALLGRCLGGFLNGNVGVIQTMVGEITINPKHEPRAYAVMPFVWSVGTIIGPSIGGYFANPVENMPSSFSPNGLFGKYPYLLPNLICAGLMLVSILAGYLFLEETHPEMSPWSMPDDAHMDKDVETPLVPAQIVQAGTTTAAADLRRESYGTFNRVIQDSEETWNVSADGRTNSTSSDPSTKVFTKRVVMLVVALGIFTFHSMSYDYLLPIFFQDERVGNSDLFVTSVGSMGGGLGLSIQQVGVIISINGVIALFIQAVIFPIATALLGVWKLFILVSVCHSVPFIITPYLVLLPQEWLYTGIYACLTVRNLLGILAYPTLLILIKEAAPSNSCLGKINGLAASTGAACRTMASPIAGILYGIGIQISFTALAWWASGLVALIGTAQAFLINQRKDGDHHQVRPRKWLMPTRNAPNHVVHVHVADPSEETIPEA